MAKAPTTYIPNTTAARTRKVDALSFPFPARPQPMTIYLRFVELGTAAGIANRGILNIGSQSGNRIQVYCPTGGTVYRVRHGNASGTVDSTLSAGPSYGQLVELCVQLYATGAVQIHQSIDGATTSSATASSVLPLPQSWSAASIVLNTSGVTGAEGMAGFRDLIAVRGVHDLATMRKRVGIA